jgi:hypothetical protein
MAEPTGLLEAAGRGGGAIVNLSSTAGVESSAAPPAGCRPRMV